MRALIIDDDPVIRVQLAEHLKALHFAVDTSGDGTQGSYLARTADYDIIILDYMLPEKQGPAVCQEIRRVGRTVPILMLSALSDSWRKVEMLNHGADDYLVKPFSTEELSARIRALLRRPRKLESEVFTIDDLRIDTRQQTVRRGSRGIYLTRKEFMLLEYLMRNQGAVLSRGMILEHVWDAANDPFSNTIESHVMTLRKKLEGPDSLKLIHTIPGRGYKLDISPY
jgi:two-component system, OmpR family, response regulator